MNAIIKRFSEIWHARQARAIVQDPVPYWSGSRSLPRCVLSQKAEYERWNRDESVRINHELNFALNVYEKRYPRWRENETPNQRTERLATWFEVIHLPFQRRAFAARTPPRSINWENPYPNANLASDELIVEEWEEDFSWLAQRNLDRLEQAWDRRKKFIIEQPFRFYGQAFCYEGFLPWEPPPDYGTWWIKRPTGTLDSFGRALDGHYWIAAPGLFDLIKKDEQYLYSVLVNANAEETQFFRDLVKKINERLVIEPGPWVVMFPHLRSDAIDAVEKWLGRYPTALESGLWFPSLRNDDGAMLTGHYDQTRLSAQFLFCRLTGRKTWNIVKRHCPCGESMLFEVPPEGDRNFLYCPKCGDRRSIDCHGELFDHSS